MKKIIALLAFVTVVTFSSCQEEEVKRSDPASGRTETNKSKWD